MLRWLFALSLLVVWPIASHAQVAAGVGVRTCAQFGQDYKVNPSTNETIYINWALGLLSGMNIVFETLDKPKRNLASLSLQEKKVHMREFCDQHPLKMYMDGVLEMFGSLPLAEK